MLLVFSRYCLLTESFFSEYNKNIFSVAYYMPIPLERISTVKIMSCPQATCFQGPCIHCCCIFFFIELSPVPCNLLFLSFSWCPTFCTQVQVKCQMFFCFFFLFCPSFFFIISIK